MNLKFKFGCDRIPPIRFYVDTKYLTVSADPKFSTIVNVMNAVGFNLQIK